jgi:hypothetical protein
VDLLGLPLLGGGNVGDVVGGGGGELDELVSGGGGGGDELADC